MVDIKFWQKTLEDKRFDANNHWAAYIPFACHISDHTVLTKDGLLLQSFVIYGFDTESISQHEAILRTAIRDALVALPAFHQMSIWIQTIRSCRNLVGQSPREHPTRWTQDLETAWTKRNYWDRKFVSDVVVTLALPSLDDLLPPQSWYYLLRPGLFENKVLKQLQSQNDLLESMMQKLVETLASYHPKRLGIKAAEHGQEGMQSKILEYMQWLLVLRPSPVWMPMVDISELFAENRFYFGNQVVQVRDRNEQDRFAALLSLKLTDYVAPAQLDEVLTVPSEMIITQIIHAPLNPKQREQLSHIQSVYKLGMDAPLQDYCQKNILWDPKEPQKYRLMQTTIMLIDNNREQLNQSVGRMADYLLKIGIPVVREDIFLEQLFLSQLPGNRAYICRDLPMPVAHLGTFALLGRFYAGLLETAWGSPITLFRSAQGQPFFFHFHVKEKKDSCIIGFLPVEQRVLMHFLMSFGLTRAKAGICLYFHRPNIPWLEALGMPLFREQTGASRGRSWSLWNTTRFDVLEDREFLQNWLIGLLASQSPSEGLTEVYVWLPQLIDYLANQSHAERTTENVVAWLRQKEDFLTSKLCADHLEALPSGCTTLHHYDDASEGSDDAHRSSFLALDVEHLYRYDAFPRALAFGWILPRVLDGLQECNRSLVMIDNLAHFSTVQRDIGDLTQWRERLKSQGGVIIGCIRPKEIEEDESLRTLVVESANRLYFEDRQGAEVYRKFFKLPRQAIADLSDLRFVNRLFLIEQDGKMVTCELNITGMDALYGLLLGGDVAMQLVQQAKSRSGQHPDQWLPSYYQLQETL